MRWAVIAIWGLGATLALAQPPVDAALTQDAQTLRAAWAAEAPPKGFSLSAQRVGQLLDLGLAWEPQQPGVATWKVRRLGSEKVVDVVVRVPPQYDVAKAWPLVVTMHGMGGQAGPQLEQTAQWLGARADEVVIVSPQWPAPAPFTTADIATAIDLLPELSRLLRLDMDRVHVTGYSMGGHRSWLMAVLHTDRLASVMPMAGCLNATPLADQQAQMLLPNLAGLTVLGLYGMDDGPQEAEPEAPAGSLKPKRALGIATVNNRVRARLGQLSTKSPGLASVQVIGLPGVGHGGVTPTAEQVDAFLAGRRPGLAELLADPPGRSRRFRDPSESWLAGVRLTSFQGKPLAPGQAITLPRASSAKALEDARHRAMDKLLGELGVRVDRKAGVLAITHRRGRDVEAWLFDELLDLRQPLVVTVNGKPRYTGTVRPDGAALLDWLRLTGDTARRPWARVAIPPSGQGQLKPPPKPTPTSRP